MLDLYLAKVGVGGSNPLARSKFSEPDHRLRTVPGVRFMLPRSRSKHRGSRGEAAESAPQVVPGCLWHDRCPVCEAWVQPLLEPAQSRLSGCSWGIVLPRSGIDGHFASPALPDTVEDSLFDRPARQAHRQHQPKRIWQSHKSMGCVEPRGAFVEGVDHDHRRPDGVGTLECSL
jgi:hypothetical protein